MQLSPLDGRRGAGGRATGRVAVALAVSAALGACGDGGPATDEDPAAPPARPLSVLLVTLDTTRADALSCYAEDGAYSGPFSAPPDATPHLDALAARGVRYTNATTVAPLTLPAHASMLSGRIPPAHGIRENGLWGLPLEVDTVAERARAAGVRTAAFVAAVVLDAGYGLDQGFEVYDQPERASTDTSSHYVERPAAQVVDAALAWLDTLAEDEQALTWVHLFDPHQPYAPPPPFRPAGGGTDALYQGEVRYVDAEVGRLLTWLDEHGRADDTLVLVVADHGESLGEHGEWSHAAYCFEATMRVPFLVAYPNGHRAGEVSDATVSVVDVAPTVLAALGLGSALGPEGTFEDGHSLYGASAPEDRAAYFESYSGALSFGWAPIVGRRAGPWKVLQSSTPLVFDLGADPREEHDLAAAEGERLGEARAWLARTLGEGARRLARDGGDAGGAADPDRAAQLAALGYASAGAGLTELPDALAPGDLPAPHERAQEYRDTLRASALQNEGRHEEAQRLAHSLVRANAGNVVALQTWTGALLSLERYDEALPGLERLVGLRPTTAGFHYNLGLALARVGRHDAAIGALWRSVELDLDREAYLAELQRLLRELGRREQFDDFARRWQALQAARAAAAR